MTPPDLVLLSTIPVHEDKPGTLEGHVRRLAQAWRDSQRERDQRIAREVRTLFQEARRR